jgi:hypothetical protein
MLFNAEMSYCFISFSDIMIASNVVCSMVTTFTIIVPCCLSLTHKHNPKSNQYWFWVFCHKRLNFFMTCDFNKLCFSLNVCVILFYFKMCL